MKLFSDKRLWPSGRGRRAVNASARSLLVPRASLDLWYSAELW